MAPSRNEVWFKVQGTDNVKIEGGDFVVAEFSVTDGEATDLYPGYDTKFASQDNTGFRFGVDRFGSDKPATWWNQHITAAETTFRHVAGTLNFAIKGTMTLYVRGGVFGSGQNLKWDNVFLAQGHSGGTNNWWFGVTGATGGLQNQIQAATVDGRYMVKFQRGGNDVDEVYVFL